MALVPDFTIAQNPHAFIHWTNQDQMMLMIKEIYFTASDGREIVLEKEI